MADRPIFTLLGLLVLNLVLSLHCKHVIVKRELLEDDDVANVDLSSDLLGERRFPEKRDLFAQSPETYAVSPGKIVDEEADDNSDPDGADDSSGDVSGSGYQREAVPDIDGNTEKEEQSEKSLGEVDTHEPGSAEFVKEKADIVPSPADKTETKRQFIARPRSHYYSHPGYVYLKAPPIRQKTIVTTRIPRPPIMMSYKQFLRRLTHERYRDGYHSPYHADDGDDDDYADREHDEGEIFIIFSYHGSYLIAHKDRRPALFLKGIKVPFFC